MLRGGFNYLRRQFIIPHNRESGHSEQIRTDNRLQMGPPPDKIDRPSALRMGMTGHGVNGFPMTGGMLDIGHVPLVHVMRTPMLKSTAAIDEKVTIPGIYAGESVP